MHTCLKIGIYNTLEYRILDGIMEGTTLILHIGYARFVTLHFFQTRHKRLNFYQAY